ncbi:hypothetical protein Sme01_61350 [Sphaerisporangium melleum]|uniref:Uncharacterized protein n=1 Tax=Sphaerisporangium melleum TaxID=321316 RepID=A0A917R9V5_9ACTN|nr:hypothetical protein [Sphaerisporangium melleum]GGK97753.1 hypothetical protein GCM10007964_44970 [Sphaerisporangium melleum]GII73659.1 hypothetical protein Sme01_61350 [Sphaerisporangium melleum]
MPEDPTLTPELRTRFARFVALAWADDSIRRAFENDPRAALAEAGVEWPNELPPPGLPIQPGQAIDLESLESSAGGALGTIGTVSCPTGCFSGGQTA